jgi:3'-5' exoribonuclease
MAQTADTPRVSIAELQLNSRFAGHFCISNAQLGRTRNDKPYLRCLISDATGRVPGRMWGADDAVMRRIGGDGFVRIAGETQPYQGELQLIIQSIEPFSPTPEQLRDLIPASDRPAPEMLDELAGILRSVTHPAAKALVEAYLTDEHLMGQFAEAPAAQAMHHAFLGGLLEHTLTLLKAADALLPLYPKVNRDLVLIGLFLHDLGKTRELSWRGSFDYTDRGLLIGHIVEGAIMLHDKAHQVMREQGMRFPGYLITTLQHIILAHHGVPEHGAARYPSTPEAIFVAMLDNFDAKLAIALDAARPELSAAQQELGGNFTERIWALDNVRLFRPDPLADTP